MLGSVGSENLVQRGRFKLLAKKKQFSQHFWAFVVIPILLARLAGSIFQQFGYCVVLFFTETLFALLWIYEVIKNSAPHIAVLEKTTKWFSHSSSSGPSSVS
jgi:hypothetical protein